MASSYPARCRLNDSRVSAAAIAQRIEQASTLAPNTNRRSPEHDSPHEGRFGIAPRQASHPSPPASLPQGERGAKRHTPQSDQAHAITAPHSRDMPARTEASSHPAPIDDLVEAALQAPLPWREAAESAGRLPVAADALCGPSKAKEGWGEGDKPRDRHHLSPPPCRRFTRAPKSVGCRRQPTNALLCLHQGRAHRVGLDPPWPRPSPRSRVDPRPEQDSSHASLGLRRASAATGIRQALFSACLKGRGDDSAATFAMTPPHATAQSPPNPPPTSPHAHP